MDPQIPRPGELIAGRLLVERVLGAGGMGVVLAARHVELGRLVAVKMLRLPSGDERAFERLRREARAAAKLRGEHVVRVIDVGTLDSGAPFIVMEYVAGRTLAQAREAAGRIPMRTAVDWVLQACEGLAEAHGLGIVHRDIKPSNLLLTLRPDGTSLIKLLDFGIAKSLSVSLATLTETGGFLGSPLYASPEQVRDTRTLDHRTDIWSTGVVLYQLLTGQLPFPSYTATAALASLVADPPVAPRSVAPDLPVELERVLLRCLEKDPENRYGSVAELARALEPWGPRASAGATDRVTRILNQAGRLPSDPPPAAETFSTRAPSHDGSLAASRTASQVLQPVSGAPRQPTQLNRWWPLAGAAVVLGGWGLVGRGTRPSPVLVDARSSLVAPALLPARSAPTAGRTDLPTGVAAPAPSASPLASVATAVAKKVVVRASSERSRVSRALALPVVGSSTERPPSPGGDDDFGPRK